MKIFFDAFDWVVVILAVGVSVRIAAGGLFSYLSLRLNGPKESSSIARRPLSESNPKSYETKPRPLCNTEQGEGLCKQTEDHQE